MLYLDDGLSEQETGSIIAQLKKIMPLNRQGI